jgi:hypothetical protein
MLSLPAPINAHNENLSGPAISAKAAAFIRLPSFAAGSRLPGPHLRNLQHLQQLQHLQHLPHRPHGHTYHINHIQSLEKRYSAKPSSFSRVAQQRTFRLNQPHPPKRPWLA